MPTKRQTVNSLAELSLKPHSHTSFSLSPYKNKKETQDWNIHKCLETNASLQTIAVLWIWSRLTAAAGLFSQPRFRALTQHIVGARKENKHPLANLEKHNSSFSQVGTKAFLFKDWREKCCHLAIAWLRWITLMLFSLLEEIRIRIATEAESRLCLQ